MIAKYAARNVGCQPAPCWRLHEAKPCYSRELKLYRKERQKIFLA